ncbi:MAG TPA: mycothiol synthase, partial [Corynebacterium sp.]|nr:mycothiol synthase [Corynebacterium sp.]
LVAGGAERVILYVEEDNAAAVKRYRALGFTVAEEHVVYS